MLKKPQGFFITGTDTGVGKTFVSSLLCAVYKKNLNLCYFKPLQTGCEQDDDTTTVVKTAGLTEEQWMTPSYRLLAPLSPDRAAEKEDVEISLDKILTDFSSLKEKFCIVEGAGGLEVPIIPHIRMSGLIKKIDIPVLIVASTRLGTINHTLLTVQRAHQLGLNVLGVILNGTEDIGLKEVLEREGVKVLLNLPQVSNSEDFQNACAIVEKAVENGVLKTPPLKNLAELDQKHVWHPFTQYGFDHQFPTVASGAGSVLQLSTGESLLDAISSWWVNLHGHSHPQIAEAVSRQAHTLEHAIFSGYTHEPAVQLCEKLLQVLKNVNASWSKVFFSDNGSTAVEVALKMAYQFQKQQGQENRKRFLALRGSYHGDTLAAMSVSEREGFHQVFTPLMAPVDFLVPDDFSQLEQTKSKFSQYAAVIFEPLIQGAGGMKIYSSEYLQKLCLYAKDAGVLTVADEIFTGFYRTGTFLASEQAQVSPDLICLSKGITGGFLPLAVTITNESLFESFRSQEMSRAFLHGHSYTANPIACAAALASFELLNQSSCRDQIRNIERWTKEEISSLREFPMVSATRVLGTIGAFEANSEKNYLQNGDFARRFAKACEKRGALVRPLGSTVYTVPPYSTTQKQMSSIYKAIRETLFDIQRGSL